jgi:predicted anti-sigma-YlaC factor YlaD
MRSDHDCREARQWLAAYLEGAIDSRVTQFLLWHLDHCRQCALVFASARDTFSLYFSAPEEISPPSSAIQ